MIKSTFWLMVLLLSSGAFLAALLAADCVFLRAPQNADEFSYLFQAYNFADGRISRQFPPNPDAFNNSTIIVNRSAGWLSRYPFGHPLFLLLGLALGDPHLISALAAALSILAICWTGYLIGGSATGIIAGLALLVSPFRIFYSGTLMSHTSALLMVSVMLLAYTQWRLKNRHVFAVVAGLAWAWFFNNRTYTAALMALPFALDAITLAGRERTGRRWVGISWFGVTTLTGVVLLLIYNRLAVGDFMTMIYHFNNPTDTLGFGLRCYSSIDHTFRRGVKIFISNLGLLDLWLWGFPGSLIVWAGLLLFGWKKYWSRLCLAASLCVYLGYIYYWYAGAREAGPAYYYETLPFLALSGALGMAKLLNRLGGKKLVPVAAVALVFWTGLVVRTVVDFRTRYRPRSRILRTIKEAPARSLIFIDPPDKVEAHRDVYRMIFNPRGLESDPLVALWIPEALKGMSQYFAGYTPFRLIMDNKGKWRLVSLDPEVNAVLVQHDVSQGQRQTGRNEDWTDRQRGVVRVAREEINEEGFIFYGRHTFLAPGRYLLECEFKAAGFDAGRPVTRLEGSADYGRNILAQTDLTANGEWETGQLEFKTTEFQMIEPRVWYCGNGDLFISDLRIRELLPP